MEPNHQDFENFDSYENFTDEQEYDRGYHEEDHEQQFDDFNDTDQQDYHEEDHEQHFEDFDDQNQQQNDHDDQQTMEDADELENKENKPESRFTFAEIQKYNSIKRSPDV